MSSDRKGLRILPPELRLAVVITISVVFIFINDLKGATILLIIGLTLFLANKNQGWKLALSAPISGGMMFIYNMILSPPEQGGIHWLFFTINQTGIERGLIMGMRLTGVMLISFAWLFSTPIPEIYKGLAWIKPTRTWVLGILRGIQIIKREFVALTQSLIIRGLRWNSIWANIKNLVPLSMAIIPRVIENSQQATFAFQSHHSKNNQGNGNIEVRNLFVRYSPRLPDVIRNISLNIKSGEFVYLAGKNAAGKTTLLRVMGGVISWIMGEYKGEVLVSGSLTEKTPLATLSKVARYVAPDPFASIYGLTVGQEISFLAKDEKKAKEALEIMKIKQLWNRETTKLSGGEQVRLVLAGALVSGAKTLLLDSPMQELDPQGRLDFMEALKILRSRESRTIIIADPFWKELAGYTDRVIVLEEGILTQDLSPNNFFNNKWLSRCNLSYLPEKYPESSLGNIITQMSNIHVTLGGNKILKGIDFTLREGEIVAIMGPNGSGKTTAMLTLAGAIKPVKGEMETTGRVAYVFQHAALQTIAMTVEEELSFGPKILGWSKSDTNAFVGKGLEWTSLDPLACPLDLHPSDIRMLVIAACNTKVSTLILDEPTIGLDSVAITRIANLIQRLRGEGKAIVIITHDQQFAKIANRVVFIKDGKVEEKQQRELE